MGKHEKETPTNKQGLKYGVSITLAGLLLAQGFALPAWASGDAQPLFEDWILTSAELEARQAQASQLNTGQTIDGQRVYTLQSSSAYELGTIKVSIPEEAIQRLADQGRQIEGIIGYADDFTIITSSTEFRTHLLSSTFSVAHEWFSQLEAGEQAVNPFAVEGGLVHRGDSFRGWTPPEDGRSYVTNGRFDSTAINASYYEGLSLSPSSPDLDGYPQHSGVVVLDDAETELQLEQLELLRPLDHNPETLTSQPLGFWLTELSGSRFPSGAWAGSTQTSLSGGVWVSIDRTDFNPLPADFAEYTLLSRETGDVETSLGSDYRYITTDSVYERPLGDGRVEKVSESLRTTLGTPFGGTLPDEWSGSLVDGSIWLSDEVRDTALVSVEGNWNEDGYFVSIGGNVPTSLTVVPSQDGTVSIDLSSDFLRIGDWNGSSPEVGDVLGENDLGGVVVIESEATENGWKLVLDPVADDARIEVREGLRGNNQSLAGMTDGIQYLVSDTSFNYRAWIEGDITPPVEPPVIEPPVTEPPVIEPPVIEPPVTEPPVIEPPVIEPPVTEPPVVEPPVIEPPVVTPPVIEPPVEEVPPAKETPVITPPVKEVPSPEKPTETNTPAPPFKSDSGLDEFTSGGNLAGLAGLLTLVSAGVILFTRKLRAS